MEISESLYWSVMVSLVTCSLGWARDKSKGKPSSIKKAVRTPTICIFIGQAMTPYFVNPIHLALASAIGERWLMLGFKTIYAYYYPTYKWV